VRTAQQLAMANDQISAEAVEITEFPDLAAKYSVRSVPQTVINGKESLIGAQPAAALAEAVLRAIGK
jgi:predicted DsbA family dithiol-disulfide isomerase